MVEMKKALTPREVVAQTKAYASWVKDFSPGAIEAISNEFREEGDPEGTRDEMEDN